MIVVADTSPINYLILIRQINLLQQLYAQILIPSAVLKELKHPAAPNLTFAVRESFPVISGRKWLCLQSHLFGKG